MTLVSVTSESASRMTRGRKLPVTQDSAKPGTPGVIPSALDPVVNSVLVRPELMKYSTP